MGRDFKKEIQELDKIYSEACKADIQVIAEFLSKYFDLPCLCIGSGGSFSVASCFEYLFTISGGFAKRITPLELTNYQTQIKKLITVLFTAGGKNHDSINAYRYLSESEPYGLLTCCMRIDSPIKQIQRKNTHNYFYEYRMPVQKDGYLAVESLISSIVILCRAFEIVTRNPFFRIPENISWSVIEFTKEQIEKVLCRETLIVLHGGITTPAAIDLESKFGETSLGNIQLVDYRNLAHGRHFWLEDRKESTAIVSLSGTSRNKETEKILNLFPEEIPILQMVVDDSSVLGLFQAFRFVFYLVMCAGEMRGINPGKPGVATFGKKLYHQNYNICRLQSLVGRRNDLIEMAIYRKKERTIDESLYRFYASRNKELICGNKYRGIIFDFDDTVYNDQTYDLYSQICKKIMFLLSNGIKIGIATGRGKSVRKELQKQISKEYWNEVIIAYYNGGCIAPLDNEQQPQKVSRINDTPIKQAIVKLKELFFHYELQLKEIDVENPYQITIIPKDKINAYSNIIKQTILDIQGIKVIESSHSIDIVPESSSKNNIFKFFSNIGYERNEFLAIGDSGHAGGNDFELLNHPFSLCVDQVSDDLEYCWNYSKPGYRNLEATIDYLNKLIIQDGYFFFQE